MPKRVLVVAFDFPPRRTSGVYRPTAMIKYLLRFGWQSKVLTVRRHQGDIEDSSLLERIPSQVDVVRTRYFRFGGWERGTATAIRSLGALRSRATDVHQPQFDRFLRWLGQCARTCLYFPDETVGWIPFGVAKATQLHRAQPFDVIYTSSMPRSTAVIGLLLKLLLRVPWVAEFRDPWLPPRELLEKMGEPGSAARRKLLRWLYTLILRHADAVVAMNPGHAEELKSSDHVSPDKLAVVRNGFDEDDFRTDQGTKTDLLAPGYVHLTHIGDIYPGFTGNFFPALTELVRDIPDLSDRLRINIIGFPDEETRRYLTSNELQHIVQVQGFVSHAKAIQAMRSSQYLLLFYADPYVSRVCVPGKIYEYLRVGRRILALAYDGGVKRLVEEGNAGWVLPPDNTEAIKQVLRRLVNDYGTEGRTRIPSPEFVAQFRYDRLAGSLAGVLEGVARNGH